jgi:hypothetical protein
MKTKAASKQTRSIPKALAVRASAARARGSYGSGKARGSISRSSSGARRRRSARDAT